MDYFLCQGKLWEGWTTSTKQETLKMFDKQWKLVEYKKIYG